MNSELTLIKQENVEMIVRNAPQSYNENQSSHDNCLNFGKGILIRIQQEGMTDELDQEVAAFIARARKTVKKMNEKRSPVTKLFDEIRTVFTKMEGDVDPDKSGTLPYQLQQYRNQYAAQKQKEIEARRREEALRQAREKALKSYRIAVEEDYKLSFNRMLNSKLNELTGLNNSITLENFEKQSALIRNFPVVLSEDWITTIPSGALLPPELDAETTRNIRREVMSGLLPRFREQYTFEIETNRDSIEEMLYSKKNELEEIAKAGVEEARRREEEMKQREAEEAKRREEERRRKEEEEKQKALVQQQQNEMAGLFAASQAAAPVYQPKLQVKKKIVISSPLGFLDILNLWWTSEGCNLSIEELSKKFKSQITYCEKLANDKSRQHFIESKYVTYEDDIKAK